MERRYATTILSASRLCKSLCLQVDKQAQRLLFGRRIASRVKIDEFCVFTEGKLATVDGIFRS